MAVYNDPTFNTFGMLGERLVNAAGDYVAGDDEPGMHKHSNFMSDKY